MTCPVSQDYTDAWDAATQEMITDKTFIDTYANLMYFNVPACTDTVVKYPARDPFVGKRNLTMSSFWSDRHLLKRQMPDMELLTRLNSSI